MTSVVARSTTTEQIEKVQKFVNENKLDSNQNLKTALTNAQFNLKWAEQNVPIIKEYLAVKTEPDSAVTHTISSVVLLGVIFISFINY